MVELSAHNRLTWVRFPVGPIGDKIMGDINRAKIYTQFIIRQFPKCQNIIEVASGKGHIARKLANKGKHVIAIEKKSRFEGRSHKKINYQSFWFTGDAKIKDDFDLIVGMHPDEATYEIIEFAAKNKIPFSIVPCCLKGRGSNAVKHYHGWIKYLESKARKSGFQVFSTQLKMSGKNIVIWGKLKNENIK